MARVLLVEDEPNIASIIVFKLETLFYVLLFLKFNDFFLELLIIID